MSYIDSRDLLTELRDLLEDDGYDYNDDPRDPTVDVEAFSAMDDDGRERVAALRAVLLELPGETVDGRHSYGCTMIPEADFKDYAREYAEDIGALSKDVSWPHDCIDWEHAARELAIDYSSVDFDGITYLCRD